MTLTKALFSDLYWFRIRGISVVSYFSAISGRKLFHLKIYSPFLPGAASDRPLRVTWPWAKTAVASLRSGRCSSLNETLLLFKWSQLMVIFWRRFCDPDYCALLKDKLHIQFDVPFYFIIYLFKKNAEQMKKYSAVVILSKHNIKTTQGSWELSCFEITALFSSPTQCVKKGGNFN